LWLALFIGVVLTFIFLPKKSKKNLLEIFAYQGIFLLIIVIIYALFSFIFTQEVKIFGLDYAKDALVRLQSLYLYSTDQDSSVYYRILSWEKALSLFVDSPVVGIGFGQKLSFDLLGWPMIIEVRELHNNFVGMILQMGILGFLSFIVFNIYFLIKAFSLLKKASEEYYPYILGAISCYILFIISANFGTYFDTNIFVIFYWIFIGIIFVIGEFDSAKNKTEI
jgi:O-antigen ligase